MRETTPAEKQKTKYSLLREIPHPKILLTGMPDRQLNHLVGNIAQYPQGPKVKDDMPFLPVWLRELINDKLKNFFNPNRATPYAGLHLIGENLKQDVPDADITVLHHPKKHEIFKMIESEYVPIIGLSLGAENQIPDAENLVAEIQEKYRKWAEFMKFLIKNTEAGHAGGLEEMFNNLAGIKFLRELVRQWAESEIKKRFGEKLTGQIIANPQMLDDLTPIVVSGNYGATAAKKIFGKNTVLNGKDGCDNIILWDDNEERLKKDEEGEIPFIGEGVHDMRKLLFDMGFNVLALPDDPIKPAVIHEEDIPAKSALMAFLKQKIGISTVPDSRNYVPASIGCPNKCSFCSTRHQFNGKKTALFKDVESIFQAFLEQVAKDKNDKTLTPESIFWIQDENFTKTEGALEKMCELVEKSGENIKWGTNTDIAGLSAYKEKYGDFKGLVRGGISVLWIGVESKADFFKKRGNASEEDVAAIVKELQSLGMGVIGSFIVGLPIHTEGPTVKNADGSYESLNIYEDIDWWLKLNTSCNQVSIFTTFNLIDTGTEKRSLLGEHDDDVAHIATKNVSQISDLSKLEQIDRMARRKFFQRNGPVSLRTILAKWDGFKAFKDSVDPVEKNLAVAYYWSAKRFFHILSLSTVLFSETFFEKCSDDFLQRLSGFLEEIEIAPPPDDCDLNEKYKEVVEKHDAEIAGSAKFFAEMLRKRFIEKINRQSRAVLKLNVSDAMQQEF